MSHPREMNIVIIFQNKFMDFNFNFYCLTRFLSILPFQLLLGFLINLFGDENSNSKSWTISRYYNFSANKWRTLGSLSPLLAEINESFYHCYLFMSSLFWGWIRMVKCLFVQKTGFQEFENHCFIYMYEINFLFSLLWSPLLYDLYSWSTPHLCVSPLKLEIMFYSFLFIFHFPLFFWIQI